VRIALITDTYAPQVNGVTTVVRRIAETVRAAGHAVAVVAPRYPDRPGDDDGGDELRVPSLPFPPYPSIRLSLPFDRHITRFLDGFRPDLVHVATEGPLGVVGRRYALRHALPLVTSFHTDFPRYARHYGTPWLEPLVRRWLLRFHRPARLIHTPGEAICKDLRQRGLERAVIWGRGVDIEHFRPYRRDIGWRRWLAGGDDTAVVLHVGRLARKRTWMSSSTPGPRRMRCWVNARPS
jgi:glycosyltransferase involved in cell wall biosynthesis